MGTIRFVLRKDKVQKKGYAPLEIIYQIRGQRKGYNTGQKVMPQNWDETIQKAVYVDRKTAKKIAPHIDYDFLLTQKEVDIFNAKSDELKNGISKIEQRFEIENTVYSAEMVIDKLKENRKPVTKKEESGKVLFDFIDKYLEEHKTTREKGSLSVYRGLRNHLHDYETMTKNKVSFSKIDYSFFQSFQNFLIDVKNLNNTTVAKQISTVKTFLGYAKKQGVEISDKYKDFKIRRETLEVIALTNEEFENLYYLDLDNNKRLAQVRDVFCFACLTGLRYSDLNQLKREHIKGDEIRLTVKKTKDHLMVPLLSMAEKILAKYESVHRPLPVISNQKLNSYIKELCKKAGINEPVEIVRYRGVKREAITYPKYKLIGVHTGRKTFATLSLEKGMSAEEVMTITGHKDYKSFKRYVKITEQRKKIAMKNAWE